jgi:opacity protein-like surface antigen
MRYLTVLACMALVAPAAAQAAGREGSWETTFGVVFQNSSDADFQGGTKAEFDSDTSFVFGLGYHYTDNLEFGGRLGLGTTDYEASIVTDADGDGSQDGSVDVRGDLESTTLLLDATWNFMSGPFSPFVTGAIGWSWVDTNIATGPPQTGCWWDPWWGYVCTSFQDTKTLDGFTYQLGVGARYDVTDTVAVHGSYRINWIDFDKAKGTPDFDGFQLSFGWKF